MEPINRQTTTRFESYMASRDDGVSLVSISFFKTADMSTIWAATKVSILFKRKSISELLCSIGISYQCSIFAKKKRVYTSYVSGHGLPILTPFLSWYGSIGGSGPISFCSAPLSLIRELRGLLLELLKPLERTDYWPSSKGDSYWPDVRLTCESCSFFVFVIPFFLSYAHFRSLVTFSIIASLLALAMIK